MADDDAERDATTPYGRTSLRDQAPSIVAALLVGLVAFVVFGRLPWFPFSPQFAAIAVALIVYLVLDARLMQRQL